MATVAPKTAGVKFRAGLGGGGARAEHPLPKVHIVAAGIKDNWSQVQCRDQREQKETNKRERERERERGSVSGSFDTLRKPQ